MAMQTKSSGLMSRRAFLKTTGLTAGAVMGGALLAACAPATAPAAAPAASGPEINTQQIKDVVLRQIGTGVSAMNEIQQKAQEDLGFTIQMTALSTTENNQRAITQPGTWDVFDGE